MAKKQEVVDTWGRLAGRVNSKALEATCRQPSTTLSAPSACQIASDAGTVGNANARDCGATGKIASEAAIDLHGPELDDVD